jgi:hypothetical protein
VITVLHRRSAEQSLGKVRAGRESFQFPVDKGALGSLVVRGDERPDLFRSLSPEITRRHSRH